MDLNESSSQFGSTTLLQVLMGHGGYSGYSGTFLESDLGNVL